VTSGLHSFSIVRRAADAFFYTLAKSSLSLQLRCAPNVHLRISAKRTGTLTIPTVALSVAFNYVGRGAMTDKRCREWANQVQGMTSPIKISRHTPRDNFSLTPTKQRIGVIISRHKTQDSPNAFLYPIACPQRSRLTGPRGVDLHTLE